MPLTFHLNIWIDESFSLHATDSNLATAIHEAISFGARPPAYFILLFLWRQLHSSIFFARLLSILLGVIVIALIPQLSKQYLPKLNPYWLTLLAAFNPYFIWAVLEIREYPLILLWSALLLVTFFKGYLTDHQPRLNQIVYGFVAILSLYTYYYLAFILVSHGLILLLQRKWRKVRAFALCMFINALLFIPYLAILKSQLSVAESRKSSLEITFSSLLDSVKYLTRMGVSLAFRKEIISQDYANHWLSYLIIGIGLIAILILKRHLLTPISWSIILLNLGLFGIFIAVINLLGKHTVLPRHLILLFLPILLMTGLLIYLISQSVKTNQRQYLALALVSLILVLNLTSTYIIYQPMAKEGDQKRVSHYLKQNAQPSEEIFVFSNCYNLALSYYDHGSNKLHPLPAELDFSRPSLEQQTLSPEETQKLLNNLSQYQSIWWVKADFCDLNLTCSQIDDFLTQNYVLKQQQDFYKADVSLLEKN
ncbi:glycosyltransferase family 39 protein [Spirulina subsalsa FACHB-351]|uniref:Glycosyltransferase family 39 protein n=1 Tax=Spirulina subsalsa FACHB-351 TaxID=234711 RepID=A0ABT3L3A5_9CYAN|nr:glycosyltransferase family 39 protein [Spirulina subsalsa]MCW6035955.1 glycosyltransferase family 39 protein [Spirulina subsalsa FACHB-351]